jgi:hypothetical protein
MKHQLYTQALAAFAHREKGPPDEASFHTGRAKIPEDDLTTTFTITTPFGPNASYGVSGGLESRRR